MKNLTKLSASASHELAELFAANTMQKFIADTKAATSEDSGTFKVIISSDDEDRQGEKVNQDGLDFGNYMKNPVVLWGHDYYSPPIGIATSITRSGNQTIAEGKFAPTEFAQQIRMLYEEGFQRATSIGFIPKEFDDAGNAIKAEVLEFSFVPIPANPYALSMNMIKQRHINLNMLVSKGIPFNLVADKELTFVEAKKAMSEIFAAEKFDNAAFEKVSKNYSQFKKDVPTAEKAAEIFALAKQEPIKAYLMAKKEKLDIEIKGADEGAACQLDDGTPGVLARDPNDPDGALVCVPVENAGAKATADDEDENNANPEKEPNEATSQDFLENNLETEHAKHLGNTDKAIDEYRGAMGAEEISQTDMDKAGRGMHDAADDEHDRHEKKVDKAIDEFGKSVQEFHDSSDNEPDEDEGEQKAEGEDQGEDDEDEGDAKPKTPVDFEKAIDEFGKAIDGEHDTHRKNIHKAIDGAHGEMKKAASSEEMDKCMKSFKKDVADEHGRHADVIQKCIDEFKSAAGYDGETEKTLKALNAVAKLSKGNRALVKAAMDSCTKAMEQHSNAMDMHHDAHKSLKAVHAALSELHGNPQDGGGEDEETPEDGTKSSKIKVDETLGARGEKTPDLSAFLSDRRLTKSLVNALTGVLAKHNELARAGKSE